MKVQYVAVIGAFLKLLTDVGSLEAAGLPRSELNVTYLLLTEKPTGGAPSADWVLHHYNYPRAKAILKISGADLLTGPYVVSALRPMSNLAASPSPLLLQDMSHCRSDVAVSWVQEFERRAGHSDFWKEDTRSLAILNLRTFVSNAAPGLAAVGKSTADFKKLVAEWITWK
jgi:hypothetical protein